MIVTASDGICILNLQCAGQTPPLEESIPGLKLATGDFFYKDQAADRGSAVRRKQASKRLAHDGYTQIALKALPGNQEAEQKSSCSARCCFVQG